MKYILLALVLLAGMAQAYANEDYKTTKEYLALRDSMRHAFNSGDSARFFPALSRLEDYLLKQKDLHAYYTQRCNEIVFQMNRQRIFEAYKLARQLSKELRERKLDDEMYMAYNMLGHLNRYCGNKAAAKQSFYKVIELMEKGGYYESMPPIYMNLVNVEISDDPEEAQRLLDKAAEIAAKYSPDRVFDIETRKTLSYYNGGDTEHFLEGYKKYREGVAQGQSSVHGRSMDIYYQACMGNTDEAVAMARKELGEEAHATITKIYEQSGRWKEAFESLRAETNANDSVNNVILSNSIQIFRDELTLYDMERKASQSRLYTMAIIIALLLLLLLACGYILFSHRRHMRQIKRAYEHALESDKMKAAFIQNMSHEVRTPLNVISGFAQVLANPELSSDGSKRKEMAKTMLANTRVITNQIDEMLELSFNESSGAAPRTDVVIVNKLLNDLVKENKDYVAANVSLNYSSTLPDDFSIKTQHGMLRRALNTLIDNAIKNTSRGTITLKAGTDGTMATIAVEDTGTGIPTQDAERVFERFVKLDSFKTGLGLGLPLCRQIVNRLGGTVSVDTSHWGGARLVVTLPID